MVEAASPKVKTVIAVNAMNLGNSKKERKQPNKKRINAFKGKCFHVFFHMIQERN
jgi:hypothetical protein